MHHVGVIVDDLAAATAFFEEVGLTKTGEASLEGSLVDRITGLEGARSDIAMLETPDGHSRLELTEFHAPPSPAADAHPPANVPGLRHLAFEVDDVRDVVGRLEARGGKLVGELVDYGGIYRTCYVRGPAGIIVELAQPLG